VLPMTTAWCLPYVPIPGSTHSSHPQRLHIQISTAGANQRSVHTTNVQQDILQYLRPSSTEGLGFEIPASLPKDKRGLESHITARFLIPRRHLEAFEADPDRYITSYPYNHCPFGQSLTVPSSIIARFKDTEQPDWALISKEWPTFLYNERAGWNETHIRNGLFRGHVLARVSLPS